MKPNRPAQGGAGGQRGKRTSGTGRTRTGSQSTPPRSGGSGGSTGRSGSGSGTGRGGGSQQFSSRGAGRTGRIAAPGERPRATVEKTLGGEQVEGRQAVRELLIAGNRKVHEIWVSGELIDSEPLADIVEIARSMRVQVSEVARKRLESQARSEAPQGVIAFAAPLKEVELSELLKRHRNSATAHRGCPDR
jgi:23S rRNA (guanosine2251-2'-O)-methyltransferase